MAKKDDISDEDKALFRGVMQSVRPLDQKKLKKATKITKNRTSATANKQRTASHQRPPAQDNPQDTPAQDNLSNHSTLPPVSGQEVMQFNRSGVQTRQLNKLRRGQMPIEAELDLHGMSLAQARPALVKFIDQCQQHQRRHVVVVHGKGPPGHHSPPKMKNSVNNWLRQIPAVLAFHSCQAKDGGTGAVYVLLKKS